MTNREAWQAVDIGASKRTADVPTATALSRLHKDVNTTAGVLNALGKSGEQGIGTTVSQNRTATTFDALVKLVAAVHCTIEEQDNAVTIPLHTAGECVHTKGQDVSGVNVEQIIHLAYKATDGNREGKMLDKGDFATAIVEQNHIAAFDNTNQVAKINTDENLQLMDRNAAQNMDRNSSSTPTTVKGQQQDFPISFMAGQQQQITGSLLQQQHHNASTSGAISDHDRALLDTLDSPKPNRCAY
ncbi:hypothetical protein A4A49_02877 [Nicotiana attenuata]|uniref:Uncharacterized protein n=1 Tax=Nicotiana attenuata TaxID=49451 RepID=A0A314L247_NICAT|nr:hypothetical protein A4A49_02877 [Nicotiana attenuata]